MAGDVMRFLSEIADTPMSNRRQAIRRRAASLRMRGLALGFLLGLSSSVGLFVYEHRAARAEGAV
jgi:hypothetical protein